MGFLVLVVATLVAAVTAGAQQAAPWTLSLTVTKTVEGDGLDAFIAAHPEFGYLLNDDIYQVTATCSASATVPTANPFPFPVPPSSIDLAGNGSEGSATVKLGAGKQATIPITVEDSTGVGAVNCIIAEAPLVSSAAYPVNGGPIVSCQIVYRPGDSTAFTADGQSATLNVVNQCVGSMLPPMPPPPIHLAPEFTG